MILNFSIAKAVKIICGMMMIYLAAGFVSAHAAELGPKLGTKMPHDLSIVDGQDFDSLKGKNGAVVFFVRSVNWCPYCKKQIIDASTKVSTIDNAGYNVIYVTYDSANDQMKFQGRNAVTGHFIADRQSEIIDAFGIRDPQYGKRSFAHGVPYPIIFIINANGEITHKFHVDDYAENNRSYVNRTPIDDVITAIETR